MDKFVIAALLGYLSGSVPFGLLLAKFFNIGDLRKIGSGNIGATNVLRTGRKDLAALTLLLDGAKGALAVLLALHIFGSTAALFAGFASVLGHIFPLWLRFNGGKGVATCYGVLLAVSWVSGLLALGLWIVIAFMFRYSSLAALISLSVAPIFLYLWEGKEASVLAILLAMTIWLSHYQNIKRLIKGTESRIGLFK